MPVHNVKLLSSRLLVSFNPRKETQTSLVNPESKNPVVFRFFHHTIFNVQKNHYYPVSFKLGWPCNPFQMSHILARKALSFLVVHCFLFLDLSISGRNRKSLSCLLLDLLPFPIIGFWRSSRLSQVLPQYSRFRSYVQKLELLL